LGADKGLELVGIHMTICSMKDAELRRPEVPMHGTESAKEAARPPAEGSPSLPNSISMADEVREYLVKQGRWRDFLRALDSVVEVFSQSARIRVEIVEDPEEPGSTPAVALYVTTALKLADFRAACARVYRPLRNGNSIYPFLAILKDC
jgi:hypothetical protein